MTLGLDLGAAFGPRLGRDVPLAPFTTLKVGGPADWFVETRSEQDTLTALAIAHRAGVPVTILGGGSNVLISDDGIRGLVVRPRQTAIAAESSVSVRADAGVAINGLVRWAINRGLAGVEAWAGTPGTVGGAVFGNAHFKGRGIGDLITSARVASIEGVVRDVASGQLTFAYDFSTLQTTREVLLSAVFAVEPGRDPAVLRAVARESLAFRKRTQPLDIASAGCIFQNPDPTRDKVPDGIPASAGALIDRAGLKGRAIGAAVVSPAHANFILNRGGARARDIRDLIQLCKDAVRRQFGVELREEIRILGSF